MKPFLPGSLLVYLVLMTLAGCQKSSATADQLPRYRFTPGQQLTYQSHGEFKFQNGSFITDVTTKIWVIRQNGDGSWRLLSRSESSMHRNDSNSDFSPPDDKQTTWTSGDAFPDGHTGPVDSTSRQSDAIPEIFLLPKDDQEMKAGWKQAGHEMQGASSFSIAPGQSGAQIVIHLVHTTPSDEIYLSSNSSDITFDLDRGLPVSSKGMGAQGYGFVGKTTDQGELKEVVTVDPTTLKQMSDDFSVYLAAEKEMMALFEQPELTPQSVDSAAVKIKALLQKARTQLTFPEFQQLIDKDLANLPEVVTEQKKEAQQQASLLQAPAADWKTTDLQGIPHALSDYKGKVVVLDFWYRGCGWCMLAMPQVKEVAAHFAGQPVVVLAMTTDTPESKDADFVAQKMQLTYPTLYARQIAQQYQIQGFPTMLILDQHGVIKDIQVGYSPTLRDDVERKVAALLTTAK